MMQMNIFTMKLKLPKCNTVTPCPFCNHQKAKTIRHFVVRGFFQSSRKSYKESAFLLCHDSTLKNVINCGNSKNYKCMSHLSLSKQNQFSLIFLSYGPEHVYSLYHTEFQKGNNDYLCSNLQHFMVLLHTRIAGHFLASTASVAQNFHTYVIFDAELDGMVQICTFCCAYIIKI